MKYLAKLILKIIGWRTTLEPLPARHGIIIVYPHTSNWDFPLGILWNFAEATPLRWVAKDSWFKPPIGWLMRALGGLGINRDGNNDITIQLRDKMLAEPECWLCIAPEGTRSYKDYIHMGYYHIAAAANVPIGIGSIDYKTKTVAIGNYRMVKPTMQEELAQLALDFAGIEAFNPAQASALQLRQPK